MSYNVPPFADACVAGVPQGEAAAAAKRQPGCYVKWRMSIFEVIQDPVDAGGEFRNILLDHLPGQLEVYPEAFVNQHVPSSSDVPPRDLRILVPQLLRQALHSLTDDLDAPSNGVLLLDVVGELIEGGMGRILFEEIGGLEMSPSKMRADRVTRCEPAA